MRLVLSSLAASMVIGAAVQPASADCTCRARGVVAAHGETLCIRTPEGVRLARCEKVTNVASWRFLDGPCPVAELMTPDPPRSRPMDVIRAPSL
jgi:hypothetical protein